METAIQALFAFGALAFFLGMMISLARGPASGEEFIDPDDARKVGLLVGMRGGSIPDAATMCHTLDRFLKTHGRRASTRDIATVLKLIESTGPDRD